MLHWAVTCALAKNFLLRNCSVHCHQAITWGLNNRGTCSQKLVMWREWQPAPHKKHCSQMQKLSVRHQTNQFSILLNGYVSSQCCKDPGRFFFQCSFTEVHIRINFPNLRPSCFLHKGITCLSHSRILHFLAIKRRKLYIRNKNGRQENPSIISCW